MNPYELEIEATFRTLYKNLDVFDDFADWSEKQRIEMIRNLSEEIVSNILKERK